MGDLSPLVCSLLLPQAISNPQRTHKRSSSDWPRRIPVYLLVAKLSPFVWVGRTWGTPTGHKTCWISLVQLLVYFRKPIWEVSQECILISHFTTTIHLPSEHRSTECSKQIQTHYLFSNKISSSLMWFSDSPLFILQVSFQVFKYTIHKSALIFHCYAPGMLALFLVRQEKLINMMDEYSSKFCCLSLAGKSLNHNLSHWVSASNH